MIGPGAKLVHRLNEKEVILLRVNKSGNNGKSITLKCRYMDNHGQFHIYEFFPYEILELYLNPELLKELK